MSIASFFIVSSVSVWDKVKKKTYLCSLYQKKFKMKHRCLTLLLLFGSTLSLFSSPVDPSTAQLAATKFAEQRFSMERQAIHLTQVRTGFDDSFYIYNIGERGFVIIAADDAYRPVIGYSNESLFNGSNIPPALADHLEGIAESIRGLHKKGNVQATPLIAAEWESLLQYGRLVSRNGGRGVDYLCQTQWNQTYPYNYGCPDDPNGSGGHAIVGCLATAMSQLMRFWAYPIQGIGSHCYNHEDYGMICADFGNTTYDWDHMPNVLNNNASEAEKTAVGTLCFHCGVTIEMGYGPDGSGGASGPIPGAMHQYFNYTDQIQFLKRNDYDLETWKTMVKEQFDMGWPMYYGGCQDDGCHAFVCDGYDDFDLFHFNLGWGGGSDGWYIIDEAPYTHPADAMFNFVPAEVYNLTPMAPTNFTAAAVSDVELKTQIQWTNPTTTQDGTPLGTLDEVVLLRDNKVIMTLTDVAPGATMEVFDERLPYYDHYRYSIYVVANGRHGRHAYVNDVAVGPSCPWTLLTTTTNPGGWQGGSISVYGVNGREIDQYTMTNATPSMHQPSLPIGNISFGWNAPEEPVSSMVFIIKDAGGNVAYSFSGSSDELPSGIFFSTNNSCGESLPEAVPTHLLATNEEGNVRLTWEGVPDPGYGYHLYRDGLLFRLVPSGTTFLDEEASLGGHCYQATVLYQGGENGLFSNESCVTVGPCYPPQNLDYVLTPDLKIELHWQAPNPNDGLSEYVIYRKRGMDGTYQFFKRTDPSTLHYKDTRLYEEDDYYYRVYAYYYQLDCTSAPANRKDHPDEFELHAYYSPTGVYEEATHVKVYPNPTSGQVTILDEDLYAVEVYNLWGQVVLSRQESGASATLDLNRLPAGRYVIRLIENDGSCILRQVTKQ
jgi:hypothetical protein